MDDLWTRTRRMSEAALASGALQPIATESLAVEEAGIPFTLRILSSLSDKARARERLERAGRRRENPFLPPDPALLVTEVPPAHRCVLNKFCVIRDHLLLVTRAFESQQRALTEADFAALAHCMAAGPALGFYNGGPVAGASQPHKHLQLLPLGEAMVLPFDPLLTRAALAGAICVPELPFPHRLAALPKGLLSQPNEAAAWLQPHYRALLGALDLGIDAEGRVNRPYNLLVTTRWLLLVPRCREKANGVSINALGFAGALLAKSRPEAEVLIDRGLMASLASVVSAAP